MISSSLDRPHQRCGPINGVSYSRLMGGLKKADVRLNRKMLAQLAVVDPGSFTSVVSAAKS